jgi:hypothetical protein
MLGNAGGGGRQFPAGTRKQICAGANANSRRFRASQVTTDREALAPSRMRQRNKATEAHAMGMSVGKLEALPHKNEPVSQLAHVGCARHLPKVCAKFVG